MEESLHRGHGSAGFEKAFLFSDCQEKNEAGEPLGPSRINVLAVFPWAPTEQV